MTFILHRSASVRAVRRAGLAAASTIGLIGSALALPAVQSEAMVEVSRAPYQASLTATCNGNGCVVDSALVGIGRRLEINHLSCDFRTSSNTHLLVRTGVAAPDNTLTANLGFHGVTTQPYGSSGTVFTVSERVFMFVPSNRKLRIMAFAGGGSLKSFGCFISGDLVRLKQS